MTVPAPRREDASDERPGAFETLDGDVVLYDPTNADAWIQSTVAIDFEDVWASESA